MRRWFMLIFVMTSVVFLSGCEDEDIYSTREEGIGTAFVLIGESFDPMEGVRIIQVITEDHGSTVENDIDDIEVIINNVNTSRIGEYEVSYRYEAMEGQGDNLVKLSL